MNVADEAGYLHNFIICHSIIWNIAYRMEDSVKMDIVWMKHSGVVSGCFLICGKSDYVLLKFRMNLVNA